MRTEIKSKVKTRIEQIINQEIEKVRRPKAIVTPKIGGFDSLSSVNQLLQGSHMTGLDGFEDDELMQDDVKSCRSGRSSASCNI